MPNSFAGESAVIVNAKLVEMLPGELAEMLPGELAEVLPGELAEMLPGELAEVLPGELAEVLPGEESSTAIAFAQVGPHSGHINLSSITWKNNCIKEKESR